MKKSLLSLIELLTHISINNWFLLAFMGTYLILFIRPIFLKNDVMQFPIYIPGEGPIGSDFKVILSFTQSWFINHQTPYIGGNFYPPFDTIVFIPFLYINFLLAYRLLTIITVLCYAFNVIIWPCLLANEGKISSLQMFVITSGLFSYGLQFELQRGQFNVIAITLCWIALWIYFRHNDHRIWAYILLTVAIQLKVYPLIFILLLTNNWDKWKANIIRLVVLGFANLALLFILGPDIFVDFVHGISAQIGAGIFAGANMSIQSFFGKAAIYYPTIINSGMSRLIELTVLISYVVCLVFLVRKSEKGKLTILNSYLLLACTIGAMIIPTISWDYKLAILPAPVTLFLAELTSQFEKSMGSLKKLVIMIMVFLFALSYSWMLFPNRLRPQVLLLQSNFPALILMLAVIMVLAMVPLGGEDVKFRS